MESFQHQFQQLDGPAEQLRWLTQHRFLGVLDLLVERGLIDSGVRRLAAPLAPRRGWVSPAWLAEERRAMQGLTAACRCLVLKGGLLAYLVYPAPEQRWRSDLDVLVAPDELPAARAALRALGFGPMFDVAGGTPIDQESWIFRGSAGRFVLDLHWAMRKHPLLRACLNFEEQWRASVELSGLGPGMRGQGHVHALLNSALHWFDGIFGEEPALAWLLDQDLLWRGMSEHQYTALFDLARDRGVAGLLAESLRLSRDFLDTPVDGSALEQLCRNGCGAPATRLIALRNRPVPAYLYAMWSEPGPRAKLHRLRHSIFPPPAHLHQRFPEGSRWGLVGLWWRRIRRRL